MSTPERNRKNQIATRKAVEDKCNELFRAGEKITEATVRGLLGGGSTTTILAYIREWEVKQRTKFLELEAKVTQYEAGDVPPGVPEPLWEAIKPVWGRVLEEAQNHAESRVAGERAALAADREALEGEAARIRDLDARWQQEKQEWAARIDELNSEIARQKARLTEAAQDLIQAGKEATAQATMIDGLREQLAAAEAAHEADQARWVRQVDDARQDGRAKEAAAASRIRVLEEQLGTAQGALSDLRIEHERARVLASAAEQADARSQAEIGRLRQDLANVRAELAKATPAPAKKARDPKGGKR